MQTQQAFFKHLLNTLLRDRSRVINTKIDSYKEYGLFEDYCEKHDHQVTFEVKGLLGNTFIYCSLEY